MGAISSAAPAVFSGATQVANLGDPQPQPADLEQRIRESIFRDIRDGKLVVPSDSTVASQRSAFAFKFDPDRFVLMDVELEDNGKDRKLIAGPIPADPASSVPMDSSLFHKTLFESAITKREVEAINRRNLLPSDTFRDAPELGERRRRAPRTGGGG